MLMVANGFTVREAEAVAAVAAVDEAHNAIDNVKAVADFLRFNDMTKHSPLRRLTLRCLNAVP